MTTDSELKVYEGGLPAAAGVPMQQIKTSYATAMTVQRPRVLPSIEKTFLTEAGMAGERFFYGWGAGKEKIEGASIDLAMALVRTWGNCAVEMQPVQEVSDAWIFTAAFVDLETGFTLMRQFRQSKNSIVYGKHDEFRKADIRFQIGQSKAIRNVVLNALPKWLADKGIDAAKENVIELIKKAIEKKGHAEIARLSVERLAQNGVPVDLVLGKFGRPTIAALTIEDLVVMRSDALALHEGIDTIENLYPSQKAIAAEAAAGKSRTDKATESASKKGAKTAEQEPAVQPETQKTTTKKPGKQQTLGTDFPALEEEVMNLTNKTQILTLQRKIDASDLNDAQKAALAEKIEAAFDQFEADGQ
ncbi:hypothetical protein [Planctomicrobium piriforme]|uniref:Uncharacterized protein n=1 Tax=Planctomicrobium piriforme TaxID=1576369 RepID=A0A1I3EI44_9PLAN|nr:hypothetical protein [Planctomicrobium piriforme]SFH98664.1 hypothetical protein SAMN05421753_104234 [Planctomicrobium piriforme]